jgi:TRL-like protein family
VKKLLIAAAAVSLFLAGCATPYPVGGLYTDVKLPVNTPNNSGGSSKIGTAECSSILAMVATGDCSVETAKKNGGITQVSNVDWEAKNILGIFGTYKVKVYGN